MNATATSTASLRDEAYDVLHFPCRHRPKEWLSDDFLVEWKKQTATSHTDGSASRIEKTTYDYDASGIRVSALHQTDTDADGIWDDSKRTEYLVDHDDFTGYQQVVKETAYDEAGSIVKVIEYQFGHDEISQSVTEYDASGTVVSEDTHAFGHDGHGSVRILYDAAAVLLQAFTYEAYGPMLAIHNAQATVGGTAADAALTTLLYSGEQFDSRIGQQYLRARYYDPASGRFSRVDPFMGNSHDPQSLHKYLYVHGDPVNGVDPTGEYWAAIEAYSIYLEGVTAGFEAQAAGLDPIDGFKYGMAVSAGMAVGADIGLRILSPYAGAVARTVRVNSQYWKRLFRAHLDRRLVDPGIVQSQRQPQLLNLVLEMKFPFKQSNFCKNLQK